MTKPEVNRAIRPCTGDFCGAARLGGPKGATVGPSRESTGRCLAELPSEGPQHSDGGTTAKMMPPRSLT